MALTVTSAPGGILPSRHITVPASLFAAARSLELNETFVGRERVSALSDANAIPQFFTVVANLAGSPAIRGVPSRPDSTESAAIAGFIRRTKAPRLFAWLVSLSLVATVAETTSPCSVLALLRAERSNSKTRGNAPAATVPRFQMRLVLSFPDSVLLAAGLACSSFKPSGTLTLRTAP